MKKVLIIQQVPHEGLGIIGGALRGGFDVEVLKVYRDRPLRSIEGYSALVVLGGPMGVYEEERYPFLADEIRLIESAIKKDIPTLGVCLGSQLIARAAGARVYKGGAKEIGWYDISLTQQGARDPLLLGLPSTFEVFQWHGDTFDIPSGGVPLASSALFPNQALKVGSAYGFQFHLEVTEAMVRDWIKVNCEELGELKGKIDPKAILLRTPAAMPALHSAGKAVLSRFFRSVGAGDGRLMCSCAHC